jgi:mono/diheme cytochrome c family protein
MKMNTLIVSLLLVAGLSPRLAQAEDAAPGADVPGKALYENKCLKCHTATGTGVGKAAKSLDNKPTFYKEEGKLFSDEEMIKSIKGGSAAIGKSKDMEGYKDLTDQQIKDLVSYIHTLVK